MFIDFAIISTDITTKEAKDLLVESTKNKINSVTVSYDLLKLAKKIIKSSNIDISCFIDFPLGISDPDTRQLAVKQAIGAGATSVDISMPQNLAANRRYDKIREDVSTVKNICLENNIKTRYILEYRSFDHKCLKKICEIFDDNNIEFCFPSTSFFLDNLSDNIIASSFLHENSKEINIICSGNFWTENHFNIINKSGIYGFRTSSISVLKNYNKYLLNN